MASINNHTITLTNGIKKQNRHHNVLIEPQTLVDALFKVCNDTEFVICLDPFGYILSINEAIADKFAKSRESLIGTCMWDLLPPEVAQVRKEAVRRVIETGSFIRLEDQNNGTWFDSIVYPVHNAQGEVSMVFIISRDATERYSLENSLKRLNGTLEQLVAKRTAELVEKNQELKTKTEQLEDLNAALRVLLEQRQKDKSELETNITSNIDRIIIPILQKILNNNKLDALQREQLKVIHSNLRQITSSFATTLSADYLKFTPQQLQIANLIKLGRTTKEIAQFLGLSHRTIEVHRENIRRKLSLNGKNENLRTHLLSVS
jgi:PAS domain S-box-containing protein